MGSRKQNHMYVFGCCHRDHSKSQFWADRPVVDSKIHSFLLNVMFCGFAYGKLNSQILKL